jgi:hypothetical protein
MHGLHLKLIYHRRLSYTYSTTSAPRAQPLTSPDKRTYFYNFLDPSTTDSAVSEPLRQATMHGLMSFLVDRERFYPMHSLIASYLSIKDIRNVKLVCKEGAGLYDGLKKTQRSVDALLRPYFTDTKQFRFLQSRTCTLIGGVLVVSFFRRERTDGRPLAVASQVGADADAIVEFLVQDGYVLDHVFINPLDQSGIQRVVTQIISVVCH